MFNLRRASIISALAALLAMSTAQDFLETTSANDNQLASNEAEEIPQTSNDNGYLNYIPIVDQERELDPLKPNKSRVNGGQAVKEIVPYQISMQMLRRGRWHHFCGGSIIGPNHMLTAAHCVDRIRIENITAVCGTLTWKSGGDRHTIVAKRVHPNFSMDPRIVNDIAVLKVKPPFNIQKRNIATISLGGPSRVGDKIPVRLTGWGSTTPTATSGIPETLQMLSYTTISNQECARKAFRVTQNEICALAEKGKGACVGDSGGPLVIPLGVPQLVGIVSYGTATCAQGMPDVYTRVSSFLPYINKVITQEIP